MGTVRGMLLPGQLLEPRLSAGLGTAPLRRPPKIAAKTMSRVSEGHWVMLRPQLKRRCAPAALDDMDTRQAWHALQTIRRWHEHGHAERAKEAARGWAADGYGIGTVNGFTFHESYRIPAP